MDTPARGHRSLFRFVEYRRTLLLLHVLKWVFKTRRITVCATLVSSLAFLYILQNIFKSPRLHGLPSFTASTASHHFHRFPWFCPPLTSHAFRRTQAYISTCLVLYLWNTSTPCKVKGLPRQQHQWFAQLSFASAIVLVQGYRILLNLSLANRKAISQIVDPTGTCVLSETVAIRRYAFP